MVWSQSEDGESKVEYNPVINNLVNQDKEVWILEIATREDDSDIELIFATGDDAI